MGKYKAVMTVHTVLKLRYAHNKLYTCLLKIGVEYGVIYVPERIQITKSDGNFYGCEKVVRSVRKFQNGWIWINFEG